MCALTHVMHIFWTTTTRWFILVSLMNMATRVKLVSAIVKTSIQACSASSKELNPRWAFELNRKVCLLASVHEKYISSIHQQTR